MSTAFTLPVLLPEDVAEILENRIRLFKDPWGKPWVAKPKNEVIIVPAGLVATVLSPRSAVGSTGTWRRRGLGTAPEGADHVRRQSRDPKMLARSQSTNRWRELVLARQALPVRRVDITDLRCVGGEWLLVDPPSWMRNYIPTIAAPQTALQTRLSYVEDKSITAKLAEEILRKAGLPREPKSIGLLKTIPSKSKNFNHKAAPTFDKNPLGNLWIVEIEDEVWDKEDAFLSLLKQYADKMRFVTHDDWLKDPHLSEIAHAYVVRSRYADDYEPTESEQKQLQRRITYMMKVIEGKCPSDTCPNNRCMNPDLTASERQSTHAANLPHIRNKMVGQVGEWYCVVDGYIKWLPDPSKFKGVTERDRVEAAFDK